MVLPVSSRSTCPVVLLVWLECERAVGKKESIGSFMLSQLCVNILNMPYLFLRKNGPMSAFQPLSHQVQEKCSKKRYLLSDYSPENLIQSNNILIAGPYLPEKKHVCSVYGLFVTLSLFSLRAVKVSGVFPSCQLNDYFSGQVITLALRSLLLSRVRRTVLLPFTFADAQLGCSVITTNQ